MNSERMDVEQTDVDQSAAPRKGAAYNGDSSRDKDYFEGKQEGRKRVGSAPYETCWSAFLNALTVMTSTLSRPESASLSSWEPVIHIHQWYGSFSAKPLLLEDGQASWSRKPSLILLEHSRGTLDAVTWSSPKALGKLTTSNLKNNTTLINMTLIKTLSTKAYILLCSQPWWHYVLTFSITCNNLQIHLFDCSGIVISPPINFHAKVSETC